MQRAEVRRSPLRAGSFLLEALRADWSLPARRWSPGPSPRWPQGAAGGPGRRRAMPRRVVRQEPAITARFFPGTRSRLRGFGDALHFASNSITTSRAAVMASRSSEFGDRPSSCGHAADWRSRFTTRLEKQGNGVRARRLPPIRDSAASDENLSALLYISSPTSAR